MHGLLKAVPDVVANQIVAITSFDSGPLLPSEDERRMGWKMDGKVLWTSRIDTPSNMPYDQYDEWYIFPEFRKLQPLEVFVNYGIFSLADERPRLEALLEANPTLERNGFEVRIQMQERFWQQLDQLKPTSCLAEGDWFNFATLDESQFTKVLKWSRGLDLSFQEPV